jgi:hypothetical protein
MIVSDVILVLAQIIFLSASASNDKTRALPMFGLSILLVGIIAWAAITTPGFFWLRVFNGLILAAFVLFYVVVVAGMFTGND